MKKLLWVIVLTFSLQACLIQYKIPSSDYLTIKEIKHSYDLTNTECRLIIKAAENNELDCKYNLKLECWTYDNKIDYNLFKLAE